MEKIGQRIHARRKELKLSQKELGRLVGVSHATVSYWEADTNAPKTENFLNLAKALKTSVDELISNVDMTFIDDETLIALIKNSYPKLDEARRRALMASLVDLEFAHKEDAK